MPLFSKRQFQTEHIVAWSPLIVKKFNSIKKTVLVQQSGATDYQENNTEQLTTCAIFKPKTNIVKFIICAKNIIYTW